MCFMNNTGASTGAVASRRATAAPSQSIARMTSSRPGCVAPLTTR